MKISITIFPSLIIIFISIMNKLNNIIITQIMLYVMVILFSLFMMLLKITMREGNLVIEIFMLGKHPSPCWKCWRCSCFTFLCLILCASIIHFLSRCPCIGSMLDLNVVCLCSFDALFCALTSYSFVSIVTPMSS